MMAGSGCVPYWLYCTVMLICCINPGQGNAEEASGFTLSEIRYRVLSENPEIVAFRQELLIGSSRLQQAGRLKNPHFSLETENFWGEGDYAGTDLMEVTAQVSQVVELGGKRSARIGAAEAGLTEREMLLAQKQADVRLAAGEAFLQVLISQKRVRQARYSKDIAGRVLRTVQEKVEAGKVSAMDLSQARVTQGLADNELMEAAAALERDKRSLALLWGEATQVVPDVAGKLEMPEMLPGKDYFSSKWQQSPRWQLASHQVAVEQASLQVVLAGQMPDITFNAGIRRHEATSDLAWVAGASVPLPLFDRQQGNIEAARHRLRQVRLESVALQQQLMTELANVYQEFTSAFQYVRQLQEDILPEAEQAYLAVREGYALGRFDQLALLDAQRTLFSVRKMSLEGRARFFKAGLRLEYLTAESLYDDELNIVVGPVQGEIHD